MAATATTALTHGITSQRHLLLWASYLISVQGWRKISSSKRLAGVMALSCSLWPFKSFGEMEMRCIKAVLLYHKSRENYFRTAGLAVFEAQFGVDGVSHVSKSNQDAEETKLPNYDIHERAEIVRLTCTPSDGLQCQDKHARRLETCMARVNLCRRQETRIPSRPSQASRESTDSLNDLGESFDDELSRPDRTDDFPLTCKPTTQCLFCLGNIDKLYTGRNFQYARPNKMMDHVEGAHLPRYQPSASVPCPHPKRREEALILADLKMS